MAKSKEDNVVPMGFGDDLEQLTLLRDILFGPQIRKLQEQIEMLQKELKNAQDENADPDDQSSIYSRLKAELLSTQGNSEKEMLAQREYFDSVVRKQNVENTRQFKAVEKQVEENVQQGQVRNQAVAQTIEALLQAQEDHNAAIIKQLRSAHSAQSKQLKKLQEILTVATGSEPNKK